jgi:hypothetical protein
MDAPSAEVIATAISIFYANPKADRETILQALDNAGIPPREAWELYQFLPIAFVHVAFRDQGVAFAGLRAGRGGFVCANAAQVRGGADLRRRRRRCRRYAR